MKITCKKCGNKTEINPASLLGKKAAGIKKTLSDEARKRKRELLAVNREKRHKK